MSDYEGVDDPYADSSQVLAEMARGMLDQLGDADRFPLFASISPSRRQRCLRQMQLCASYPTPLIIQATKNEMLVEAATVGQCPGGRVETMLEAFRIARGLTPPAQESEHSQRRRGWWRKRQ